MLSFTIISVGKLKESYWREAQKEYAKRLSSFCHMNIVELKEEKNDGKSNRESVQKKEAQKILKVIPKNDYVITLDPEGQSYTSQKLSSYIELLTHEVSSISFIIGGPLGLHKKILSQSKKSISLSSFTFTHQMARIILLEQLYRAFMISNNRPYHH